MFKSYLRHFLVKHDILPLGVISLGHVVSTYMHQPATLSLNVQIYVLVCKKMEAVRYSKETGLDVFDWSILDTCELHVLVEGKECCTVLYCILYFACRQYE